MFQERNRVFQDTTFGFRLKHPPWLTSLITTFHYALLTVRGLSVIVPLGSVHGSCASASALAHKLECPLPL